MTTLYLVTHLPTSIERCFDLARSVDVHRLSMSTAKEKAIAGRTSGLINQGETVTWEATHFFIRQTMTVKLIRMEMPYTFTDIMLRGPFKSMYHKHTFKQSNEVTVMTDLFQYEVPYGILGKLFDFFILKKYMTTLLRKRNAMIEKMAASDLAIVP